MPYLFDCSVVPLEAVASYARVLEIVVALFPLVAGQDQLESHTIKRMRLPRIVGRFEATPVLFRSAFLAQYLAIAPSVAKAAGLRAMETLGIFEAARDAQRRLRLVGLSMDGRGMPREGGFPNREMDIA